jgi:alpha-ketoglutarate-dependent 2,4-dichlorophenoxyacetate dioxygenase
MPITLCPVTPGFVAEVGDVDLSQPLSAPDIADIKQAFWKYAVLIFPEQTLSPERHLAFAELFGPVEADRVLDTKSGPNRVDARFSDVSNLDAAGNIWSEHSRKRMYKAANKLWHTDSSFRQRPGLCSLLYANTVAPVGGQTEFADQRAAWDALPEAMKQSLEGLVAEHSIATSRRLSGFADFTEDEGRRMSRAPQLLVRTIPETARRSLYVAAHAGRIFGMPDAEGRALIEDLIAHVTQRQFVHSHRWRPKDLVMWDNRCTLHRGMDYDDLRWVRDMRRTTVSDVANTCEQEGVVLPV